MDRTLRERLDYGSGRTVEEIDEENLPLTAFGILKFEVFLLQVLDACEVFRFAWSRDAFECFLCPGRKKSRHRQILENGGGRLDELVLHCRITTQSPHQTSFLGPADPDLELLIVRYVLGCVRFETN
jgi:hypothetical protein